MICNDSESVHNGDAFNNAVECWKENKHSRMKFVLLGSPTHDSILNDYLCKKVDIGDEYVTVYQLAAIVSHFTSGERVYSCRRHFIDLVNMLERHVPKLPREWCAMFVTDALRTALGRHACIFRKFIDTNCFVRDTTMEHPGFRGARFMTALELFANDVLEAGIFLPLDGMDIKAFGQKIIRSLRTNLNVLVYYDESVDRLRVHAAVLRGFAIETSETMCRKGAGRDMVETFIVYIVRAFFSLCLTEKSPHPECHDWIFDFFGPI